jgi:uncharacterized SAM-binding protein YcdF (DUF218 family)
MVFGDIKGALGRHKLFTFIIGVGLCVGSVWVAFDFSRFARECKVHALAAANPSLAGQAKPHEVVVVLTGDHTRIPKAIELLRRRESEFLLISGAGASLKDLVNQQGDSSTNIHEVWQKIRLESQSTSTIENARNSIPLLVKANVQNVVLVTSDYHMFRALKIFQRLGPSLVYTAFPVTSDFSDLFSRHVEKWPGGAWKIALEYAKYCLYRLVHAPRLTKIEN